jgi:site-specific DNA-methyltransferase (adenine-specific)
MATIRLLKGDCLQKLKELEDNSIDSVVTDPPYEIGFMGKGWDDSGIANNPELWKEVLRVLKPGGHLLSFSHSRTYHRQAVAVEDAGFEIRDQIMWIYGSGFPKSHNIGKAVEKQSGDVKVIGIKKGAGSTGKSYISNNEEYVDGEKGVFKKEYDEIEINNEWEGWGTALKPAHEPIVMARKPFKGTVADNVLEWGTGGINVDGCRIGYEDTPNPATNPKYRHEQNYKMPEKGQESKGAVSFSSSNNDVNTEGRFPANIIFECTCENPKVVADKYDIRTYNDYKNTFQSYEENDKEKGKYEIKDVETTKVIHTDPNCPCYILDEQSGTTKSSKRGAHNNKKTEHTNTYTPPQAMYSSNNTHGDTGGASRFFYCPKASKKDRNEGCDDLENAVGDYTNIASKRLKCNTCGKWGIATDHCKCEEPDWIQPETKNIHPTVKPTDLMAYLVRLVTPKGGVVLDPFMGSGSTGKACVREGMNFIGIEREEEYMEIAKTRIEHEQKRNKHTLFFDI